jgi:hypothetical protein
LLSDFAPALLTYGQVFAFDLNIELNVFALASVFPWVFTMFHLFLPQPSIGYFVFKAVAET